MRINRRDAIAALLAAPAFSGCAVKYSRFREQPGPDWGYLVVSTAIELPSPIRITNCAFGGKLVGTDDHFMLWTDIAPVSTQRLDINTPELAMAVGVQALPPDRYALDHVGFYTNASQSWRIFRQAAPPFLDMPTRSVLYFGAVTATRYASIRIANEEERDMKIAIARMPQLASLPRYRGAVAGGEA